MIGAPTYEGALFPPVAEVMRLAAAKAVRNRAAAMFGSFGWSGGALRELAKIVEPVKWNITETFEMQGGPTKSDLKKAEAFGRRFAETIVKSAKQV